MDKLCPRHGPFRELISPDLEFFSLMPERDRARWRGLTNPLKETQKPGPNGGGPCREHQSVPVVLNIDLTNRCNLNCPICFANADAGGHIGEPSIDPVRRMLDAACDVDAVKPVCFQYTGGEPTGPPDFFQALQEVKKRAFTGRIDCPRRLDQRFTVADLALEIERQTGRVDRYRDWYPFSFVDPFARLLEAIAGESQTRLSCHPLCGIGTYLIVDGGGYEMVPRPAFLDVEPLVDEILHMAEDLEKTRVFHKLTLARALRGMEKFFHPEQAPTGWTFDTGVDFMMDFADFRKRFVDNKARQRKLAGKIEQVVTTGELKLLDRLRRRIPGELSELMKIPGLGPKRAATMYHELDISKPGQLREAAQAGGIRELPGLGHKTEQNILDEAKRLAEEKYHRLKLTEAEKFAEPLIDYLKKAWGIKDIATAGSYRRRKDTVGDLDILATCKEGLKLMDRFVKYEDVEKVVSKGQTRSTVLLRLGFQVDLRVVQDIPTMSEKEVETLIETYAMRYGQIYRAHNEVVTVIIFRNHGPRAGTSLHHPHSQLIAAGIIPHRVSHEERMAKDYYGLNKCCIRCDVLESERADGVRVVFENDLFLTFVPLAATVPFEIWIVPKQHCSDFGLASKQERTDLALALYDALKRYQNTLGNPDYNYVIQSYSRQPTELPYLHWYVQIQPRLTAPAGFAMGSGMHVNPSLPEDNAAALRQECSRQ